MIKATPGRVFLLIKASTTLLFIVAGYTWAMAAWIAGVLWFSHWLDQ